MTPVPERTRVIPITAWVIAGLLVVIAVVICFAILSTRGGLPELLIIFFIAAMLAAYVLLIGYVNADAKRRGMRHVLWTWLAILIPNGIGIVLYFILREPLLVFCTRCGFRAKPGFAFCPSCGAALAPVCPQCKHVVQKEGPHCVYCGASLS